MSEAQTKNCQNCQTAFTIEPEDFRFYEKIDVPPPTWCPKCRLLRRMAWSFDSTTLYQRTCQASRHNEKIFTNYSEGSPSPVYDYKYWKSDAWDPRDYGRDYDFSRSFFEQFKELLSAVPVSNVENVNSIACDYCPVATDSKNCYLCSGIFGSENCLYCHTTLMSKECVDANLCLFDEQTYSSFSVDKSFRVTNGVYGVELMNCDFMYDCRGCSSCLGGVLLRNKKYYIFNQSYSKEEYKKERKKYDLGSYKVLEEARARHNAMVATMPKKYSLIKNAPDCTGDNIENAKNSRFIFQAIDDIEDCKYGFVIGRGAKDSYDISGAGLKASELYEAIATIRSYRVYFSHRIFDSHDIYYSRGCRDSEYLFGCIALRSKKYYILNKQYTKEEYNRITKKIKEQMRLEPYISPRGQKYTFGEFFPLEHSPLPFNDSWAGEYFPISKKEALEKKYPWLDKKEKEHTITIQPKDLPDHIKDAPDELANEIIGCAHARQCSHNCSNVFKITPDELQFYRKINIALPRLCPTCRFRQLISYRNPYQLWQRQCMCQSKESVEKGHKFKNHKEHFHSLDPCPNKFQTAYAPERKDLLYCQQCYQSEII